jgi:hypothetical protein
MFSFELGKFIDTTKMEGIGHTHLNTFWIAMAQVTFCRCLNAFIQVHISKGAGRDAHTASKTEIFVHDNGPCLRVPLYPVYRANFQAGRGLALEAGAGINFPAIHVHTDKYIGATTIIIAGLLKLARLLAAEAGNTPIKFHIYNVHSVRFHYLCPNQLAEGVGMFFFISITGVGLN